MLQNIEHNASSSVCFQMCIQSPPAQWLITPRITLPPSNPPTVAYKSQNYTTVRLAVLIIHNTPDHVATLSAAQLQKIEHNTSRITLPLHFHPTVAYNSQNFTTVSGL